MKRIFVLLLSIVCCALGGVWAVPAKPIVKTLIQPDGSELKVRLVCIVVNNVTLEKVSIWAQILVRA